jgi:cell division protein FtsB
MMDSEEMGERRQVNHTPAIALGIAAVLLLIVGAMSYSDYVESEFEEEYKEKERQLLLRNGYQVAPIPNMQNQLQQPYPQNGLYPQQPQQPQQQVANQVPQQPLQQQAPVNQQLAQNNAGLAQNAANLNVESALPIPNDPEIDAIRNSLDQIRKQEEQTEQRYRDLSDGVDILVENAKNQLDNTGGIGDLSTDLPNFLRNAVENPPGGNPEIEAEMARMRERVTRAPTLAQVTSVDMKFGFVTFNAGVSQQVAVEQRYAIRRSGEIVGWVRVEEVHPNEAIAKLESEHDESTTSVRPAVGDDLIPFEAF